MYGPVRENIYGTYGTTTFPGIQTALAQAQTFSKTAVVFTLCNAQRGRLDGNKAHAWLNSWSPHSHEAHPLRLYPTHKCLI
jgi:hypothetical protein